MGSLPTRRSPSDGRIEAGNQPQQGGLAATARADERNQLARASEKRNIIQRECARTFGAISASEVLC